MEGIDSKELFFYAQLGVALLILGWFIWFQGRGSSSSFRVRESDRLKQKPSFKNPQLTGKDSDMGDDKMKIKRPLSLPGIRIDGPAHQVLGVSPQASPQEIEAAYKKLIKQYHPDKIAAPGSPQWHEAQKIAAALNEARLELLGSTTEN